MVKVTFEDEKKKLTFTIKGHAGQAEAGKDIVCSSCSILAYTIAQVVNNYASVGKLKEEPVVKLESGEGIVSCKPKRKVYAQLRYAYEVAMVGYILLAHNYPQYVGLKMFGAE